MLPSREIFDEVYKRKEIGQQEFWFELGQGQVIQALDETLLTMKKGEICVIVTSPLYAFGKMGCPPRIPSNTSLEFEMELASIERKKSQEKKISKTLDQRKEEAVKDRLEGNEHFKKQHFRKASKCYNQALSHFNAMYELTEEEEQEVNAAKLPIYLNLAVCFLKLNEISRAITNAERALAIDNNNAKAYWRLGQAFAESEELELAKTNFLKAAKLDTKTKEIRDDLEKVKQRLVEEKEKVKTQPQLFKGIFK